MDSGVVALTEKNVLIEGSHLLTIGSGTFQQWIVDGFIERKINYDKQKNWIVTRICLKEDKINHILAGRGNFPCEDNSRRPPLLEELGPAESDALLAGTGDF
ncbi:hypothetical protein pdam_00010778 [Pocillopora damicornis]|uniref:Uncharacterized protein n=1 Tax=Pocillopora damicornis TaxID=46731 RepID=A0A3M6UYG9_POCDA|nr:hypothetical protein pdam_00010778 [Pocillopora damicornis]